jgi:hypothetical protein
MSLEIPTNLREKVEASLMSRVLKFINNLNVAHKIAIVVFALGCLAFASKDVSKKQEMYENFLKFDYEQCQKYNSNDNAALLKCQLSKSEKNKENFQEFAIGRFAATFAVAIMLFPLYLIFYNIFCILKIGYKNHYNYGDQNKVRKFIHFSGILYLSITLLILIIYHENALVSSKMGNKLPMKDFTYTDLKEFRDENYAILVVNGVWTNNAMPVRNLKFKDIDSYNYVTKVECWKESGRCDHANGDVTIGADYHLTQVDHQVSEIEYWGTDKVVSIRNSICEKTRYTFNLKTELVTREIIPNEEATYKCGAIDAASFTLSDGSDIEMVIELNEAGPVTSIIGYVLRGIFK